MNCNVTQLYAEIQLNLTPGSVHYVSLAMKGLMNIQFKELTEKEGLKRLKDKKYAILEDYIKLDTIDQ